MILTLLLIFIFIGSMFLFNRRNKFLNMIAMYFLSVMIIMFTSVMYVSRLSNYMFPLQADYDLYINLSKIHIHIDNLVLMFNVAIGIFIFATLYLIKLIKGYSLKYLILFSVSLIGEFIITNSPAFKWNMYLRINSNPELAGFYTNIMEILRYFNICMIFIIAILPFIYLGMYYKNTRIPLTKKNAMTYMSCLALMEIYIYAIFIKGPFKQFMFYNLDMMGFPEQSGINYSYLSIPVISLVVVLFIFFVFLIYKPFNSLVLIRKKEMMKNSKMMNKNIRMILHIYKNSFLGIEKKTQIGKILINDGETKEAVRQFDDIRERSLQSVKKIEKMLDILREPTMVYEDVALSEIIDKALLKVPFDDTLQIEKENMDNSVIVLADEEHLTEVFVNLFTNSYEAIQRKNEKNGLIRIDMIAETDMVMINLFDNGCGINKKNYNDVFKPFYSTKKTAECGGIGLDYVKRIIRNHKGEIYFKSKLNEYTVFQIVLPIYRKGT